MDKQINPKLLALKRAIIDGMVSCMKFGGADDENDEDYDPDFDAGYKQSDVNKCDKALTDFLLKLAKADGKKNKDWIIETTKSTVFKLNKINAECDCCLIETDQREDICQLVQLATQQAGLVTKQTDITEEWREW